MQIKNIQDQETLDELDRVIEDMNNPYAFENYCGACDNFNTEFCLFRDKVDSFTNWRKIKCNNFWD